MENFTVVCWNSQHLSNNIGQFQYEINNRQPHLIGICETKLTAKLKPSFPGYKSAVRKDGTNRSGGLLFLIRENIQFCQAQIPSHPTLATLDHIGITIQIEGRSSHFYMFYNHCRATTEEEFSWYLSNIQTPALIMGDFNARHHLWDPNLQNKAINPNGKNLYNSLLTHTSLTLLNNPGLVTRIDPFGRANSVLDLCLGTDHLSRDYEFSTWPDLGSDHLPVQILYKNTPPPSIIQKRPRWKLKGADYASFSQDINTYALREHSSLNKKVEHLTEFLTRAGKSTLQSF